MAADRALVAFELHRQVVALRAEIEGTFLRLGQLLRVIRDERLYLALGHDTFESYLGEPDVGISRRHAYRLIGVVETYARDPQRATVAPERLAAIGVRKLDLLRPVVADASPEVRDQWLASAEALSTSDLALEVRAATGRPDDERYAFLLRAKQRLLDLIDGLEDAPDPAERLDQIAACCLEARARLEVAHV